MKDNKFVWKNYIAKEILSKDEKLHIYRVADKYGANSIVKIMKISLDSAEMLNKAKNYLEQTLGKLKLLKSDSMVLKYNDYEINFSNDGTSLLIYLNMPDITPLTVYLKNNKLKYEKFTKIIFDLSKSLVELESIGVLHRNIDMEKVYVNKMGEFLLGDIGLLENEKIFPVAAKNKNLEYIYPREINKDYDNVSEIKSLGILFCRILNNGFLPKMPIMSPKSLNTILSVMIEQKLSAFGIELYEKDINIEEILTKSISDKKDYEYKNAKELFNDLKVLLNDSSRDSENKDSSVYSNNTIIRYEEEENDGINITDYINSLNHQDDKKEISLSSDPNNLVYETDNIKDNNSSINLSENLSEPVVNNNQPISNENHIDNFTEDDLKVNNIDDYAENNFANNFKSQLSDDLGLSDDSELFTTQKMTGIQFDHRNSLKDMEKDQPNVDSLEVKNTKSYDVVKNAILDKHNGVGHNEENPFKLNDFNSNNVSVSNNKSSVIHANDNRIKDNKSNNTNLSDNKSNNISSEYNSSNNNNVKLKNNSSNTSKNKILKICALIAECILLAGIITFGMLYGGKLGIGKKQQEDISKIKYASLIKGSSNPIASNQNVPASEAAKLGYLKGHVNYSKNITTISAGCKVGVLFQNGDLYINDIGSKEKMTLLDNNVLTFKAYDKCIIIQKKDNKLYVCKGEKGEKPQHIMDDVLQYGNSNDRFIVLKKNGVLMATEDVFSSQWLQIASDAFESESYNLYDKRIIYVNKNGVLYGKEGNLDAPWIELAKDTYIAKCTDKKIITVNLKNELMVKDGNLDAAFVKVVDGAKSCGISKNGMFYIKEDPQNKNTFTVYANGNDLTKPWIETGAKMLQSFFKEELFACINDQSYLRLNNEYTANWKIGLYNVKTCSLSSDKAYVVFKDNAVYYIDKEFSKWEKMEINY